MTIFQSKNAVTAEQVASGSIASPVPADEGVLAVESYEELSLSFDPNERVLWQYMQPLNRPSFSLGLLQDMSKAQIWARQVFANRSPGEPAPIDYTVFASRMPGVYNLGGDLPQFVELIRRKDHAGLTRYAHACIEVQHRRYNNLDLPIVSISLVQGDALGGGFECALADDVIIAERSAKFGLPEVLFNLFPGMGAYSFLSRRLDPTRAEQMILSGRVYTAEELHEMGLVEVVVDDGEGEAAVYDFIARNRRQLAMRQALYDVRRTVNPVPHEELIHVTDRWVDAALTLSDADLRRMERLAAAQDRRWANCKPQYA